MNPSTPSLAIMEGKESSKSKPSPSSMVERKYNTSERNEDKLKVGSGLEEKNRDKVEELYKHKEDEEETNS